METTSSGAKISLSEEDMELWAPAKKAFGRSKTASRAKLLMHIRGNDIQRLKNLGLIERFRDGYRKTDVTAVTAVQKAPPVVLEYREPDDVDEEVSEGNKPAAKVPREDSWPKKAEEGPFLERVAALNDSQRKLLVVCLANTNWSHSKHLCRIVAVEVYKFGYTSEDISRLMVSLDLNPNRPNYFLPKFMKGKEI